MKLLNHSLLTVLVAIVSWLLLEEGRKVGQLQASLEAAAQEKPIRETRHWQLAWVPGVADGADPDHRIRVDVYDTEGVCIYVSSGYRKVVETNSKDDAVALGLTTSIAVLSKKDLPQGTGCQ